MRMKHYDMIVVGAGPGGYNLAAKAAATGISVALIERDKAGGTCLNRGCIPTKALRRSAEVVALVSKAAEYGVNIDNVCIDYAAMVDRKDSIVSELRSGLESLLAEVDRISGEARFIDRNTVAVGEEHIQADRIVIATGSAPSCLDIPGAELCLTSDELLDMRQLPASAVMIGGGVIGMEMACILSALGVKTTVVEYCKEILPQFDADIAKRLRMSLKRRGLSIVTGASVKSVSRNENDGYTVDYEAKSKPQSVEAQLVIMSVGRRPVVPKGLVEAGVKLTPRGFIEVDDMLNTSVEGIQAIGDVNGRCMLAHAAEAQADVVLGADPSILGVVPSVAFTMPECAMVGMTEESARQAGIEIVTASASFRSNGYAMASGEPDGVVKVVARRNDGMLLGAHILGTGAADMIAEAAMAVAEGLTASQVTHIVHAHPTLSETFAAACRNVRL